MTPDIYSACAVIDIGDRISVFVCKLAYEIGETVGEVMPCWQFVTKGLFRFGHPEVIVLLRALPGEDSLPVHVIRYLALIPDYARRGLTIREGDNTQMGGDPFLGRPDLGGFVYARARPSHKLKNLLIPKAPHLFAILVKKCEMPWALARQTHRLLLKLGHMTRHYPFPLWSSRDRPPAYDGFHNTLLGHGPVFPGLFALHAVDERLVTVSIPNSEHAHIVTAFGSMTSTQMILPLVTGISDCVDGHLVFEPGAENPQCIIRSGGDPAMIGVSYVIVLSRDDLGGGGGGGVPWGGNFFEDGVVVVMSSEHFESLWNAVNDRRDWRLHNDGSPLLDFEIKWVKRSLNLSPDEWISVVDGRTGMNRFMVPSEEDDDDRGTAGAGAKENASGGDGSRIRVDEVTVLAPEQAIRLSGISRETFASLTKELGARVASVLGSYCGRRDFEGVDKIGLRVVVEPHCEHGLYSYGSEPKSLPDDCVRQLKGVLLGVSMPEARSAFPFELTFSVIRD